MLNSNMRYFLKSSILFALFFLSTIAAAFVPGTPVNVIIPFSAGGGVDNIFRHIQGYAIKRGITMVAIYKPGADGIIAMNELSSSPANGNTISVTTSSVLAMYRIKNPEEKLTPITNISHSIWALVVHPGIKVTSLAELENAVMSGEDIKFGYGAPGQLMMLEQFFKQAKFKTKPLFVGYKGASPAVNDLIGAHINVMILPLAVINSHIQSGKVILIATTKWKSDSSPNVVLLEKKYPNWVETDAFAIAAPPNLDTPARQYWSSFFNDYVNDKQVQAELKSNFSIASTPGRLALENSISATKDFIMKLGIQN